MSESLNIAGAIADLKGSLSNASQRFDEFFYNPADEYNDADWLIEKCFLQLLAIAEAIGLVELQKIILSEYVALKESKEGFTKAEVIGGEPFSTCLARIRQLLRSIEQFFPKQESTEITKDVLQILRDIHYTITNTVLFAKLPQSEQDVHIRIEGILKCIFPDLKHKPSLTKPIKNFEPDTGIPSIETLIEYKYLSRPEDIGRIADEVLADTRGYTSKDWSNFIYVIYETNRFRPEKEWVQLLTQSGVTENTNIVVLSGEPPKKRKKRTSSARK
jgi:hypothetical protein